MDLIDESSLALLNGSPSKKVNSLLITLSFVLLLPTINILLIYFSSPSVILKVYINKVFIFI